MRFPRVRPGTPRKPGGLAVAALIRQGSTREDGSGLGEPVALDDDTAGGFLPLARERRRQRHGACDRVADRRDVRLRLLGLPQDAFEHGWNADEERDRASPVRVEGHLRVEFRQQNLGGSLAYGCAQEEG